MKSYVIPQAGGGYIPEVKSKCYWEIVITEDARVLLIERGGPLEPVALEISVEDNQPVVTDWWGWGD